MSRENPVEASDGEPDVDEPDDDEPDEESDVSR
jgi:hypothetical protein